MSCHKLTLKVIDILALSGHRCLGTHQPDVRFDLPVTPAGVFADHTPGKIDLVTGEVFFLDDLFDHAVNR
jgi:hypothetical protein